MITYRQTITSWDQTPGLYTNPPTFAGAPGKRPTILLLEVEQQIDRGGWHLDKTFNSGHELITANQKCSLFRQVGFNDFLNALEKKLGVRRRVEIFVTIACAVQNAYVHPQSRFPFNKWKEPLGIAFKYPAIFFDPLQDRG
jgi:hypothetical protein